MRRQIEGLGVGPVRTQVNRGLRHIVAIILLGLGPLAGAAPANVAPAADRLPAADALTALMDRLNQFQQLHLRFEQRVTGPGAERQQGDFYLQRPAQFRLESLDQPLVISDGETIYEYDALLAQLKLQSFDALDASSPAKVL
ncbi:MAG: outer membrane lipoprotein carrier protein LolA, partial [Gammaproteobacteria bacterium]|nr:outer membrane lipoprotein carrier protein LolA [Gammaproteobacteria bacterium]